jgi:hypothetical protein
LRIKAEMTLNWMTKGEITLIRENVPARRPMPHSF